MFDSQQELLGTHQQLQIAHENVMSHVTDNVDALVKEKALIVSGNKQLADMVENIKLKLGKFEKFCPPPFAKAGYIKASAL